MNDKNLIFLAIISSVATCGLLIPIWTILLLIYFIVKALKNEPKKKKPEVILPSNNYVSDWTFTIKENINAEEDWIH